MREVRPAWRGAVGIFLAALVSTLVCGPESMRAQVSTLPALSPEQIAARMQAHHQRRTAALHSYESRRVMTLVYKGILPDKQASEVVDMTFTAPATKRFVVISTTGSRLLQESVFQREMDSEQEAAERSEALLTENKYRMRLIGAERLPQGECYVLEVSPRTDDKFAFEGKVWVESPDFAVARIEGRPTHSPSFWVKSSSFRTDFEKIGEFWFPEKTVSTSHIRMGGDANLTIQYGPYRILSADPIRPGPP